MSGEGGQAAIFAVFLIAIAAVVLGGLRVAQTALVARAVERRAGEAAIEAAAAVLADAYVGELNARLLSSASPRDMRAVVNDPAVRERARTAASDLSVRNGGRAIDAVETWCEDGAVGVSLVLSGSSFRAGFAAVECSRH